MQLTGLPDGCLSGAEPAYDALGARHLGLAHEHDEELASDGRVPPDDAAGCERDRHEVGVGAQAEGADGEATAAVRLDRTVREVRQVEDPHAPPATWSAGGV